MEAEKMKTVSKRIWRNTYESAASAMVKHQEVMLLKGWQITQEFGGNKGIGYELITQFTK
jgi:hypothetical protein